MMPTIAGCSICRVCICAPLLDTAAVGDHTACLHGRTPVQTSRRTIVRPPCSSTPLVDGVAVALNIAKPGIAEIFYRVWLRGDNWKAIRDLDPAALQQVAVPTITLPPLMAAEVVETDGADVHPLLRPISVPPLMTRVLSFKDSKQHIATEMRPHVSAVITEAARHI